MDPKYDNTINENRLLEILNKCASYPEFTSKSLSEGSIKHLIVEQLDASHRPCNFVPHLNFK